ncbi:hypothetical protein Hanom_Chr09g00774711 [Helianthus anomalus]
MTMSYGKHHDLYHKQGSIHQVIIIQPRKDHNLRHKQGSSHLVITVQFRKHHDLRCKSRWVLPSQMILVFDGHNQPL